MNISFYLKRPKADALTSIYALIHYEGFRMKYYLPESIEPANWSNETQRAKKTAKFKEYPEFNARLNNLETDIKNVFRKWVNDNNGIIPNPETLKKALDKEVKKIEPEKKIKHTFFSYFEEFIQRSKEGNRINHKTKKGTVYNTTKGFISTLNHLKNFQKVYKRKIVFETVDLDFYNEYIKYLTQKVKLSTNTIGDHIKRIKTIMNEATENGLNTNMAFKSKYFAKPSEETDSIYLTETEIKEIEALDLADNKRLENVRDLFLVGCYTGLRYSDYSILQPQHFKDGYIETTQIKTGNKVSVPVHPTVEKILQKYNGSLPRSISNQKTNDYLKEIGKLEKAGKKLLPSLHNTITKTFTKGGVKVTLNYPKWELLTTHTARRSFATNEYLAGTPSITIMAVTGHRTDKAFLRYIKLTPNEHAKLLQLHWKKRHGLQAV